MVLTLSIPMYPPIWAQLKSRIMNHGNVMWIFRRNLDSNFNTLKSVSPGMSAGSKPVCKRPRSTDFEGLHEGLVYNQVQKYEKRLHVRMINSKNHQVNSVQFLSPYRRRLTPCIANAWRRYLRTLELVNRIEDILEDSTDLKEILKKRVDKTNPKLPNGLFSNGASDITACSMLNDIDIEIPTISTLTFRACKRSCWKRDWRTLMMKGIIDAVSFPDWNLPNS